MLSKKHRLQKTREVQATFARGRAFFSPYFMAKFKKTENEVKRFTVVVSTKVSKKAVVRNRMKRIVRVVIKDNIEKFANGDYIFTVKPKAMEIYDGAMASEFIKFLKFVRLVK